MLTIYRNFLCVEILRTLLVSWQNTIRGGMIVCEVHWIASSSRVSIWSAGSGQSSSGNGRVRGGWWLVFYYLPSPPLLVFYFADNVSSVQLSLVDDTRDFNKSSSRWLVIIIIMCVCVPVVEWMVSSPGTHSHKLIAHWITCEEVAANNWNERLLCMHQISNPFPWWQHVWPGKVI